jgi:hypothetical protein
LGDALKPVRVGAKPNYVRPASCVINPSIRFVLAYLANDDDEYHRFFSPMDGVELHCIIRRRSSLII